MDRKNSIEKRLILLFVISMVVIFGFVSIASISSSEAERKRIEENYAEKFVDISLVMLGGMLKQVEVTTQDYAQWDETYDFISDLNSDFITSSLGDDTLRTAEVSGIAIHNSEGNPLYTTSMFRFGENEQLWQQFNQLGSLDISTRLKGIILLNGKVLVYVSYPITGSANQFEPNGRLTIVKEIDAASIEYISVALGEKFSLVNTFPDDEVRRIDLGIRERWEVSRSQIDFHNELLSATYQLTYDKKDILPIDIKIDMKRLESSDDSYAQRLLPELIAALYTHLTYVSNSKAVCFYTDS